MIRATTYLRPALCKSTKKPAAMRVLGTLVDSLGCSDGGQGRNRTGVRGFAGRCMTTLPPGHPINCHSVPGVSCRSPPWLTLVLRTRCITLHRVSTSASTWPSEKTAASLPARGLKNKNPGLPEVLSENWSGKRDSNSRPRPWQGRALPTELFPREPGIIRDESRMATTRRVTSAPTRRAAPARRRAHKRSRTRSSTPRRTPAALHQRGTDQNCRGLSDIAAPPARRVGRWS